MRTTTVERILDALESETAFFIVIGIACTMVVGMTAILLAVMAS